jgi:hypothetical protein
MDMYKKMYRFFINITFLSFIKKLYIFFKSKTFIYKTHISKNIIYVYNVKLTIRDDKIK